MKKLFILVSCVFVMNVFAQVEESEDGWAINKYGVKVGTFPLKAEAHDNILVLKNEEKGFKFWVDNRVQFDMANYHNLVNGRPPDNSISKLENLPLEPVKPGGVSLRRVRMAFKAVIDEHWYGEVDLNFANGVAQLQDAYIQYTGLPNFEFKAGNFKNDFSMEYTTTSRYITFMERAMPITAFSLGRRAGIEAQWQKYDWLRVSTGISWQFTDTWETRYNVEELNKWGREMGPNYAFKAVLMPWGSETYHGLHLGYNVMYRDARRTDDNFADMDSYVGRGYNSFRYDSRNATALNRTKYLDTGEEFGIKNDWLQGYEIAGYKDGFRFQSEVITCHAIKNEKAANQNTQFFYGWYAHTSYMLFGGKHRYDVGQSEFTQPTRGRDWGDIEVMFRYDYLTLNTKDESIMGGSGQNFTFGVVFHPNNNVKIAANYMISQNDRHANARGRAYVGKDINGNYTTNSNAVVANHPIGVSFNAIQTRIEINF